MSTSQASDDVSATVFKVLTVLLSFGVIVLCIVLYVFNRMLQEQAPIVETPILRETAVQFEPGGKKYDVVIWKRTKFSTTWSGGIFQVRIELRTDSDVHTFEWPYAISCDPDSGELRDVAGDGSKVFVLSCGMDLRIVQFRGENFLFRPEVDRLDSVGSQSRFVDLDNDRRPEYIASLNFPQKFGHSKPRTLPFPVVYHWSSEKGFEEVSQRYPEYYRRHVIPELRRLREPEDDPARKELFDQALAYIEHKLAANLGMLPR